MEFVIKAFVMPIPATKLLATPALVALVALPIKVPVSVPLIFTPLDPLITTPNGSCPVDKAPEIFAALTLTLVKPLPSPANTELVIKAFVMLIPDTTLVASAAFAALALVR